MDRIREIKSMSEKELTEKLFRIEKTFIGIPIFQGKDGYPYSLFTLTDFNPPLIPSLVEDMADLIIYYGEFENADIIVSEADRGGGPLAHAVALRANLPYTLANWYPREYEGGIAVHASVGFSGEGTVFLNGLAKNQRVILIDDLLSTGGTSQALLEATEKARAIPLQAIFVAEKLSMGGRKKIEEKYKIPIKSLIQFCINENVTTKSK